MIAAVTDFVLPALFLSSAALAVASLVLTWRFYGAQFGALRAELAGLADTRELIMRTSVVEVRELAPLVRLSRVRPMERPVPVAVRKWAALRAAA